MLRGDVPRPRTAADDAEEVVAQLAGEPAQPAGPHADDAEDEEVKGCAVRARRTPYRLGADHANVGRRSRDGAPHAPAGRAPLGCRRVRCGRKRWQANEETSPQRRDGARRDAPDAPEAFCAGDGPFSPFEGEIA